MNGLVIGIAMNDHQSKDKDFEELIELVKACNINIVGKFHQKIKKVNAAYFIGKGKVEEIAEFISTTNVDTIIMGVELSSCQIRNLEEAFGKKVIDRTYLILEIFSKRAKTKQAKLQVELEQLKYLLARLQAEANELSRQRGGGVINRGAGEKKSEMDRRRLKGRIKEIEFKLKKTIAEQDKSMEKRNKSNIHKVAIIGYTNSGKSTLLNTLLRKQYASKNKSVFEKDMLFATLDTSVREIKIKGKWPVLMSDTVGFVSNLPHQLVSAFYSTLAEVQHADILLHVVDASDERYLEQIDVTNNTLNELGANVKEKIIIFNKSDLVQDTSQLKKDGLLISAKYGNGIDTLEDMLLEKLNIPLKGYSFRIPYSKFWVINDLKKNTEVISLEYTNDAILIEVICSEEYIAKNKAYLLSYLTTGL